MVIPGVGTTVAQVMPNIEVVSESDTVRLMETVSPELV
jgi:hypothetical protein